MAIENTSVLEHFMLNDETLFFSLLFIILEFFFYTFSSLLFVLFICLKFIDQYLYFLGKMNKRQIDNSFHNEMRTLIVKKL